MNKKWKILRILLICTLCAVLPLGVFFGCSEKDNGNEPPQQQEEGDQNLYLDFSGDLENMNINYAKRKESLQVQYWWDRGQLETTDHFLIITSLTSRSILSQGSYKSLFYEDGSTPLSFDKMFVEDFYYSDPAFDAALEIALRDFDYKQVYLNLARPADLSDDEYSMALLNVASSIRKYAPYCRIGLVSVINSDKDIFNGLGIDASFTLNTIDDVMEDMRNCTYTIPETEHENDGKCKESSKWVNILFGDANTKKNQPRILLIGDSISQGYHPFVQNALSDYSVDYYQTSRDFADTTLYKELEFICAQYDYDVIHFNIGLHMHTFTTQTYGTYLAEMCDKLQGYEKKATLVFATTTPTGYPYSDSNNGTIIQLNNSAFEVCEEKGIAVDDLFTLAKEHNLSKFSDTDTLHFSQESYQILGSQVAESIRSAGK